ncbi:MAG TPA: MFS transporter [Prolixibacteraceae bacterium]|nr:MFS transporter [Prolixibacteraceae bacterium]
MFASFMNSFMISAVNIALPNIQNDFNCSATTLSWVTNSFLLANAMVLLPLSKAADIWGRVRFFKIGLYLFSIFSLLSAFSPNIETLLFTRVLQGAGAALMHVTGIAILTDVYPANKRGVVLGINIGAVYAGLSLGPFIGGVLTQFGGWQLIFYSVVPLGAIAILLSHFNLRNINIARKRSTIDLKGTVLYALAIFLFIYGGGNIKSKLGVFFVTAGLALMVVFFFQQKRSTSPILNVKLLIENKRFTYSNLAAFIHYSATFGVGFLLSLYLQYSRGLSPGQAGLVLVIQPVLMAITAPFTGRLSDKINPGYLASAGLLLTSLSLAAFIALNTTTSLTYIIVVLAVLGLGFGLFTSPNTNAVMSSVNRDEYSIASGINATMRVFGQTISMMMATVFISVFLNKQALSFETVDLFLKSMKLYFIFFAALSLVGIWFSVKRNQ